MTAIMMIPCPVLKSDLHERSERVRIAATISSSFGDCALERVLKGFHTLAAASGTSKFCNTLTLVLGNVIAIAASHHVLETSPFAKCIHRG